MQMVISDQICKTSISSGRIVMFYDILPFLCIIPNVE